MPEKEEPTSKIMGLWHLLLFLILLFCVLLFITLPLLAGIGGTLWMFGPDAAREPVGFSMLLWAVGSLLSTFLITQFVESKIKKYSNAGKFTAEVASYATSFSVLALCFSGFFSTWNVSLFASALSHVVMVPFYILVAILDGKRKSKAASGQDPL